MTYKIIVSPVASKNLDNALNYYLEEVSKKVAADFLKDYNQTYKALKKNPFPLIIPCHRVVSAQGLGGFMGKTEPGTPEIFLKTKLLDLEHNYLNPLFPFLIGSLVAS